MIQQIFQFLQVKDYEKASELANSLSAGELAMILQQVDKADFSAFCRAIESNRLAEALVLLPASLQEQVINSLRDHELDKVLEEISVDDTVNLIEDMPEQIVRRIAETDEIIQLLADKNFRVLKPLISSMNPTDLAKVFEEIEKDSDLLLLFRILPKDLSAETFVEMDSELQQKLIAKLSDKELKEVIDELFLDDTVDFLEEMPASVVKRVISQSDKQTREYINQLLQYPKNSAGSIMTIEYVSLRVFMTVEQAFERIRKTAIDKETIYTCYVTDATNKLLGLVTAKDLLLAEKTKTIGEIMYENVIYAFTDEDQEQVARKIGDYGFLALPIVDKEMRLVGIVTVDDAIDVIEEENTEDIAKMAAITPTDKPYLKTGIFRLCINRLPWLLLLLISSTFSGLIISANEVTLNHPIYGIMLTACMPMLMGTGGNAGSQASAMVIRGLALQDIELKDFKKVIFKELRVALLLGFILSVACFLKVTFIDGLYLMDNGLLVASVISLSMLATIFIAKLIGAVLPLLAQKFKLDPAVVASPFITTIIDVLSLTIYCAFAVSLLGTL